MVRLHFFINISITSICLPVSLCLSLSLFLSLHLIVSVYLSLSLPLFINFNLFPALLYTTLSLCLSFRLFFFPAVNLSLYNTSLSRSFSLFLSFSLSPSLSLSFSTYLSLVSVNKFWPDFFTSTHTFARKIKGDTYKQFLSTSFLFNKDLKINREQ